MGTTKRVIQERLEDERESIKNRYDSKNKCATNVFPTVGDRVYVKSEIARMTSKNPKLACVWSGPFRVVGTNQTSAEVKEIHGNDEKVVQFDRLRIVPKSVDNKSILKCDVARTQLAKEGHVEVGHNSSH